MRKITMFAAAAFVLIGIDAWLSIRTLSPGALAKSNPLIIASGMRPISHFNDNLLGPE